MANSERGIIQDPQIGITRRGFILGGLGLIASACLGGTPDQGRQIGIPASKPTGAATQSETGTRLTSQITPAERVNENVFRLKHPDGDKNEDRQMPEGFTPDSRLYANIDTKPLPFGDLSQYSTAAKAHISDGTPDGVGYNYDYNDYCMVPGFECNQQWDLWAWRINQGEVVRVPGIGELRGGPRRSVLLVVLNLDNRVKAYDIKQNGPLYVEHGFTATGRIFDGNNAQRNERNLTGHWLWKQGHGDEGKSYHGVTNDPDDALETLVVTVIRKQWGNNPDGSKRVEDQLVRAEIVKVK